MDFIVSIYESMVNSAVQAGPRLKRRRRHRRDKANPIYAKAYKEAFRGKTAEQRAWGQVLITALLAIGVVATAILWLVAVLIDHAEGSAFKDGLLFWGCIIGLIAQTNYYHKIQDYAIEVAQGAVREDKVAKDKAAAKARKAAEAKKAKEKAEADAKKVAQVKKAKEARKAAEAKAKAEAKTKAKAKAETSTSDDGLKLEGFKSPF